MGQVVTHSSKDYSWHVGGLHGGDNRHGGERRNKDSHQAKIGDQKSQSCKQPYKNY